MKIVTLLPNIITALRILLCPVSIWLATQNKIPAAFMVFLVGSLTDFLDGYLARKFHAKTPLGALLDPVCDKVYLVAFFTLFMITGLCPAWYLGLLISINILQWVGFAFLHLPSPLHKIRFESLRLGKWSVALQLVWVGILFFALSNGIGALSSTWVRNAVYVGLASLQVLVFFGYFFRYRGTLAADLRALLPTNS